MMGGMTLLWQIVIAVTQGGQGGQASVQGGHLRKSTPGLCCLTTDRHLRVPETTVPDSLHPDSPPTHDSCKNPTDTAIHHTKGAAHDWWARCRLREIYGDENQKLRTDDARVHVEVKKRVVEALVNDMKGEWWWCPKLVKQHEGKWHFQECVFEKRVKRIAQKVKDEFEKEANENAQ
mmetsp:Transcript_17009/g.48438  ORF Transcript_17009/g.48438 Transcript_17009/m.48438 type:complete len:177 (+) Transcript_17009:101-631(+)